MSAKTYWQERIKVDPETGCWLWTLAPATHGYGQWWRADENYKGRAHRVVYEQEVGPVPEGHDLHHLCETKMCVNPEHLKPVTPTEHRRLHMKDCCPQGHEYSPENTYVCSKGGRHCRACDRDRKRKRRAA